MADDGAGVVAGADGSVWVAGGFGYTATFGAGGQAETTLQATVPQASQQVYAARFGPEGELLRAVALGGGKDELGWDIGCAQAAVPGGGLLVAGGVHTRGVFGAGGQGEIVLEAAGGEGDVDAFACRVDEQGAVSWAVRAGGIGRDRAAAIDAFADGSFAVSGVYREEAVFGPGEPGETVLPASPGGVFVARYRADATLGWVARATAREPSGVVGTGIRALADGSVLVVGYFWGEAVFGPAEPAETVLVSRGGEDVFLARYAPGGELAWARRDGGASSELALGVCAGADGRVVVTGGFWGRMELGDAQGGGMSLESAGGEDAFVAGYAPDGTPEWALRAGGPGDDLAHDVEPGPGDRILVAGSFEQEAVFGTEGDVLVSLGGSDAFAACYHPDGGLDWLTAAGGAGRDWARGVAVLDDGAAVVTGGFEQTADFGRGRPEPIELVSEGMTDVFVMRVGS